MMQLIEANWPLLVLALAIGLLVAWWVFSASRRTQVLRDETSEQGEAARRNHALIDSAPVAAQRTDHSDPPLAAGATDDSDLARLKGVGPKLIAQLHELGVTRLAQVAQWDAAEIARIDAQLGRFAGRITRDDWVGQARLLETGDTAGYEDRFGKL